MLKQTLRFYWNYFSCSWKRSDFVYSWCNLLPWVKYWLINGFGIQIDLLKILDPSLISDLIWANFYYFISSLATAMKTIVTASHGLWGLNELAYMSLLEGVLDTAHTLWMSAVMIWLTELMILLKLQVFLSEALEIFRINIWSLLKQN